MYVFWRHIYRFAIIVYRLLLFVLEPTTYSCILFFINSSFQLLIFSNFLVIFFKSILKFNFGFLGISIKNYFIKKIIMYKTSMRKNTMFSSNYIFLILLYINIVWVSIDLLITSLLNYQKFKVWFWCSFNYAVGISTICLRAFRNFRRHFKATTHARVWQYSKNVLFFFNCILV